MGDDDLPFPRPFLFFLLSACDIGDGVGRTDAASLFALAFGFPLGGSPEDDAAAASFLVFVLGAAGFSVSSTTGMSW